MSNIKTDNQVSRMIEKFGGMSKFSRALGHNNPSTVHGWKMRGFIPTAKQHEVYDACISNGIEVSMEDFIAVPELLSSPEAAE